jgi:hypothetical protein
VEVELVSVVQAITDLVEPAVAVMVKEAQPLVQSQVMAPSILVQVVEVEELTLLSLATVALVDRVL